MKQLTIVATIFMPLTLISGIYGMNFRFMPELDWRYGYAAVIAAMALIAATMLAAFKRRNWW
jgi:magnesium transporter